MTIVNTTIDHNIDEQEFKETVAKTAALIRYQGHEYLNKLKQLNEEYEIKNHKILTEREYALKKG